MDSSSSTIRRRRCSGASRISSASSCAVSFIAGTGTSASACTAPQTTMHWRMIRLSLIQTTTLAPDTRSL
eukprot:904393-Prymnesium_polylepis.1